MLFRAHQIAVHDHVNKPKDFGHDPSKEYRRHVELLRLLGISEDRITVLGHREVRQSQPVLEFDAK